MIDDDCKNLKKKRKKKTIFIYKINSRPNFVIKSLVISFIKKSFISTVLGKLMNGWMKATSYNVYITTNTRGEKASSRENMRENLH